MLGIALRDIATFSQVNRALEAVGFEIIEAADRDVQDGAKYAVVPADAGTPRDIAQRVSPNALGPQGDDRHT